MDFQRYLGESFTQCEPCELCLLNTRESSNCLYLQQHKASDFATKISSLGVYPKSPIAHIIEKENFIVDFLQNNLESENTALLSIIEDDIIAFIYGKRENMIYMQSLSRGLFDLLIKSSQNNTLTRICAISALLSFESSQISSPDLILFLPLDLCKTFLIFLVPAFKANLLSSQIFQNCAISLLSIFRKPPTTFSVADKELFLIPDPIVFLSSAENFNEKQAKTFMLCMAKCQKIISTVCSSSKINAAQCILLQAFCSHGDFARGTLSYVIYLMVAHPLLSSLCKSFIQCLNSEIGSPLLYSFVAYNTTPSFFRLFSLSPDLIISLVSKSSIPHAVLGLFHIQSPDELLSCSQSSLPFQAELWADCISIFSASKLSAIDLSSHFIILRRFVEIKALTLQKAILDPSSSIDPLTCDLIITAADFLSDILLEAFSKDCLSRIFSDFIALTLDFTMNIIVPSETCGLFYKAVSLFSKLTSLISQCASTFSIDRPSLLLSTAYCLAAAHSSDSSMVSSVIIRLLWSDSLLSLYACSELISKIYTFSEVVCSVLGLFFDVCVEPIELAQKIEGIKRIRVKSSSDVVSDIAVEIPIINGYGEGFNFPKDAPKGNLIGPNALLRIVYMLYVGCKRKEFCDALCQSEVFIAFHDCIISFLERNSSKAKMSMTYASILLLSRIHQMHPELKLKSPPFGSLMQNARLFPSFVCTALFSLYICYAESGDTHKLVPISDWRIILNSGAANVSKLYCCVKKLFDRETPSSLNPSTDIEEENEPKRSVPWRSASEVERAVFPKSKYVVKAREHIRVSQNLIEETSSAS